MREITYSIALRGLGTEFSESTQPPDFARKLTNRFITLQGEAEKRPGTRLHGDDGDFGARIDGLHEYVRNDGAAKLFAVSNTNFYSFTEEDSNWETEAFSGGGDLGRNSVYQWNKLSSEKPYYSTQMGDKLILVNEDNRPLYINNVVTSGGTSQFDAYELKALIETGKTTTGTSANALVDSSVNDWLAGTFVKVNDLVFYPSLEAYAIITSVGTANIDHTAVSAAGEGWGQGSGSPTANIPYEIIDLVELDVIPRTTDGSVPELDNVAVAGTGSGSGEIFVSAVNFSMTQARPGDWIYNTTRAAITQISTDVAIETSSVSLNADISTQVAGDSLVFLKSAMPIASFAHVHYDRLYMIDARDKTKIRVSGPKDPQDFTTSRVTLDASTIDFGSRQGAGDTLISLATFQRFLVVGGKRNVYLSDGINPIADTSVDVVDLNPVGLFTQGVISPRSFANIGDTMLYASQDGIRQFNVNDTEFVVTQNLTEPIKSEVRSRILSQINQGTEEQIQLIHYPRRNWVMLKLGEVIYNYNYTPVYVGGEVVGGGSFSKFTGKLAEATDILVRSDGSLLVAQIDDSFSSGYTTTFDDLGQYIEIDLDEVENPIATEYQTAWLAPPTEQGVRVKDGRYIKPYFESIGEQAYTIIAQSDLGKVQASAQVIVSAQGGPAIGSAVVGSDPVGGSAAAEEGKFPLRWRGEQVRISINTDSGTSRDRLSKFVLYGNLFGRE